MKLTDIAQVRPVADLVVFEQLDIARAVEHGLEIPESAKANPNNLVRIVAVGCDAEMEGFAPDDYCLMKQSFYNVATTIPVGDNHQRYVMATYECIGAVVRAAS